MARQPSLYELKMLGPEAVSSEETKVFCLLFGNRCFLFCILSFTFSLTFLFFLDSGSDSVPYWVSVFGAGT